MKLLVSLNNIKTWTPDLPGDGKKEKRNEAKQSKKRSLPNCFFVIDAQGTIV